MLAASLMKLYVIILILFFTNTLKAQCVDKDFIDKKIKLMFPEANVDSVGVYIVNGKYLTSYDTLELNHYLNNYSQKQITFLYYSKVKKCGYQPGHGTIYVNAGESNSLFRKKLIERLAEQKNNKTRSRKKASR